MEKHQELIEALDNLVQSLVSEDLNSKKALAQIAFQKAMT